MGFGSLIHRSTTGEVRKQDQVKVEDYISPHGKIIMNEDGTCDIDGSVIIKRLGLKSLKQLAPRIRNVSGNFFCFDNELTSLDGSPISVGGSFNCAYNKLTSLDGCPEKIGNDFKCSSNQLTSLKGFKCERLHGSFYCNDNKLTSLEGSPKIAKYFSCSNNQLTSFEGGPKMVINDFSCSHNQITTLDGCPDAVGNFIMVGNSTDFTRLDIKRKCKVDGIILQ